MEHRALDGSFPVPTPAALAHAREVIASIPDGALAVVDGLAFGALPDLAEAQGRRLRLVALVHHPLAAESGLRPRLAAELRLSETRALTQARLVLVTSRHTARLLADYAVPQRRIRVVEPGTDAVTPVLACRRAAADGRLRILCVAALVPRKGHDLLLRGLSGIQDRPWHLDCVGSLDRDPAWAAEMARLRDRLGLGERIAFRGMLGDGALGRLYAQADLFALATRFEGYGMVFAEALARGLPILATRAGAAADTVPPEAGILVPPEDPEALRSALRLLLSDETLRRRLAAGSRAAGLRLPSWPQAASAFSAACEEVAYG